jgi:hypothetical protein
MVFSWRCAGKASKTFDWVQRWCEDPRDDGRGTRVKPVVEVLAIQAKAFSTLAETTALGVE